MAMKLSSADEALQSHQQLLGAIFFDRQREWGIEATTEKDAEYLLHKAAELTADTAEQFHVKTAGDIAALTAQDEHGAARTQLAKAAAARLMQDADIYRHTLSLGLALAADASEQ